VEDPIHLFSCNMPSIYPRNALVISISFINPYDLDYYSIIAIVSTNHPIYFILIS